MRFRDLLPDKRTVLEILVWLAGIAVGCILGILLRLCITAIL